ncbi:ribonuclease T [Sphingomonas sp. KR1UV-12]|uniref:Ribonuclease T n=1 Tax=Sphingomonas aurea TaxID=3063994 RepID=A0ABT9ELT4_9SPHN|nr:ribonuclease T [Sphingomonas sp. KR1UV-12]MDP1027933.1 ribonuclease T [Sphingomonas sp. KR1UV-12]
MHRLLIVAAMLAAPVTLHAQALQCAVPGEVPRVRPDLPSREQPRRVVLIGSYTLAISWSPQFCRSGAGDRPTSRFQCGEDNRFGFTLHGLWPDGVEKQWPQYCRPAQIVPARVIRAHLCATPSAQLQQHEWAKHGTCMAGYTPARYFARSTALYRRLRFPDMDALSRRSLTAGGLASAIAARNPGLAPEMMRITADRQGWLDEVWICLSKDFRYRRCPVHQGGLAPNADLRIWRGRR